MFVFLFVLCVCDSLKDLSKYLFVILCGYINETQVYTLYCYMKTAHSLLS